MSGLKIVLPTSFTDTSLPIVRDDKLLVPGSLALYEPAHSAGLFAPDSAALQAAGAVSLPMANVAYKEAMATLGNALAPSAASLAADVMRDAAFTGAKGKLERTPKGGIHGISTQSAFAQAAAEGAGIRLPQAIRQYIVNNQTNHMLYASVWSLTTRRSAGLKPGATPTVSPIVSGIHSNGGQQTNWFYFLHLVNNNRGNYESAVPSPPTYDYAGNGSIATPQFRALGREAWSVPANPAAIGDMAGVVANFGNWSGDTINSYLSTTTAHPSWVFYRYYLEDLTVSGRSYAQVQAIDKALFDAAFAPGGKYYGDTQPTAPSAIV